MQHIWPLEDDTPDYSAFRTTHPSSELRESGLAHEYKNRSQRPFRAGRDKGNPRVGSLRLAISRYFLAVVMWPTTSVEILCDHDTLPDLQCRRVIPPQSTVGRRPK